MVRLQYSLRKGEKEKRKKKMYPAYKQGVKWVK